MTLKDKFIDKILKVEGGYINDPFDSGGETNYGITKRVARRYGYIGDMRNLPLSTARLIYEQLYWHSLSLDKISQYSDIIALELGDTGVNQGTTRAAEFLQRALNVLNNRQKLYEDIKVDGDIGPNTLEALDQYLAIRGKQGEVVLYNMLNCLQGAYYVTLAERRNKDEKFIFGWFKERVNLK